VLTRTINAAKSGEWNVLAAPLKCFAARGADMKTLSAPFVLSISDVRLDYVSVPMDKCRD
jgi:beta-glucosidase